MDALYEARRQSLPADKTILIVEDDELMGQFIIQTLQSEASYRTLLATDAFRALNIVRNIKPSLFLLDYFLPQMNGVELYDRLHAAGGLKDVPTLFMSAVPPIKELEERHISYMEKPFELDEFLGKIRELLAQEADL
ncbi:MAG TPA: response regulator [Ktedonobacteraceae bacterium]|nr:response regulator [Ktedonobacteraceae bacterium]